jgi:hypothetical protein
MAAAQRHHDVQPLRPAGLHGAGQAGVVERAPDEVRDGDHRRERGALGRVQVQHQAARRGGADGEERDVELHGPLVGQPQEGAPVVAEHLVHLPVRGLRPHPDGVHPVGRALHHVLLHERRRAGTYPRDRQGPSGQLGHEAEGVGVQVVDEVALGDAEAVAQRLVEAGQPDAVPLLLGHGSALSSGCAQIS